MADSVAQLHFATRSISDLPARGRAACQGFIESVTIVPVQEAPSFSAIVTDIDKHSLAVGAAGPKDGARRDRVRLVWLGRRRVPGIEAGTQLRFEGMVAERDGMPTMFNPRYEIIARQEH